MTLPLSRNRGCLLLRELLLSGVRALSGTLFCQALIHYLYNLFHRAFALRYDKCLEARRPVCTHAFHALCGVSGSSRSRVASR